MPRKGFYCEVSCEPVSDQESLACAHKMGKQTPKGGGEPRHCQYLYPHIHARAHPYDRCKAGISTTMITGECTRKAWYEGRVDYYEFPSKSEAALMGTGYHELLDHHTEPEAIKEVRLLKRWQFGREERRITGQMDYYRPDLGVLADYKVKKAVFTERTLPKPYVAQLNIYRWMLETGCVVLETGEVLQGSVTELYLGPKEHQKSDLLPVPIWTLEQTAAFVNIVYGRLASDDLPPRGMDPVTSLFCRGWCPFVTRCAAAGGELMTPPYNITELLTSATFEF